MTNKTENLFNENEDTVFVFNESVKADKETLNSIRKSIENERNKAGVLLGFFFLMTVSGLQYFKNLPMFLKGVCFVLIILVLVLLIKAFSSKKMKDGVTVDGNFKRDWKGKKCAFLKFYHEILKENIKNQKMELSSNSKNIYYSVMLLSIILIILFLNFTLPMFNNFSDGDENPMTPSISENQPSPENTMISEVHELSETDSNLNTMTSESIEKGANNKF